MISPRWLKVLRDLKDNLSRTILSVLSIAVGVIAFGGMLIARNTVVSNLGLAYVNSNPADLSIDIAGFDHELLRWVRVQPGVNNALALTALNGIIKRPDGTDQDVSIVAFEDYEQVKINTLKPVSGEYPPARGAFLLERGNARVAGLNPGDTVRIKLVNDKLFNLRYAGSVYDANAPSGPQATRWTVYLDARTLSDLDIDARPNRLLMQSTPGTSIADKYALIERIGDALGHRGLIVRANNVNERGEHWAAATAGGIILILVMVGAVALVMSGFLIINVVNGLLLSQKKIIGIMKIVGADRWQIFGVYLAMMASLGFLALLIAVPLSGMLGSAIARLIAGVINFDIVQSGFTPAIMMAEVAVALLVPLVFSTGPILSALRQTAAEAISEVAPRQKANLIERILARLENVPRTLILAFRSMFRNSTRLVMTMLTLIIAGGIFIAIFNLREAIPNTLKRNLAVNTADVTVAFAAPVSRSSVISRAQRLSGVIAAEGWLVTQLTVLRKSGNGSTLVVNGGPANSTFVDPPLESGRWLAPYRASTRDEIVLSISALDAEPGLKLGDELRLKRGADMHVFRIVGFVSRSGAAGTSTAPGYAHYETVSRIAGSIDQVSSVRIRAADSGLAFTTALEESLRAAYDDANVQVVSALSRARLLNQIVQQLNIVIVLLLVVATLIAIVGGLGLAGTMSLSVMERTREVGVMRAVGAESHDLRAMFLSEGMMIGLLSALLSAVLSLLFTTGIGLALGSALRLGTITPVYVWTGYALWPVLVCVVSAFASIAPARRASQISIREALAYA